MWLHKQSPPSRAKIFTGCVRSLNNLTLSNLTLGNLGAGTGVFENNELIGFVQGLNADGLSLTRDFVALA